MGSERVETKRTTWNPSVSARDEAVQSGRVFARTEKREFEEGFLRTLLAFQGSGHDFAGINVNPPKERAIDATDQACPMAHGPRTCPFGGMCHVCPVAVRAKLLINRPGDRYEQEADRIADQIAGTFDAPVSRQETKGVHPQSGNGSPLVCGIHSSPGRPLENGTLRFMESRLGHDFSRVRVHTDGKAAESASALGARAFTAGESVVFGSGQYQPETPHGMRLLAHELAHVIQQGTGTAPAFVQREGKSDPPPESEFSKMMKEQESLRRFDFGVLLITQSFPKEYQENKAQVDQVLALARPSPFRLEYLAAVRTTLRVPKASKKKTEGFRQGNIQTFKQFSEEGKKQPGAGEEEAASKAVPMGKRVWLRGEGRKFYWVDRRDVRNVVVQAKVRLTGPSEHVRCVKDMEDLIEKKCARPGYTVDLKFVNTEGPDVFDVRVDLSAHPVSSIWSGKPGKDVPDTISHELHHLLDLPDRYDYLLLAPAQTMDVPTRLYWIGYQIKVDTARKGRVDPYEQVSRMGKGRYFHSADICQAVRLPVDQCVQARQGLD